jgi:hypothetical protein
VQALGGLQERMLLSDDNQMFQAFEVQHKNSQLLHIILQLFSTVQAPKLGSDALQVTAHGFDHGVLGQPSHHHNRRQK